MKRRPSLLALAIWLVSLSALGCKADADGPSGGSDTSTSADATTDATDSDQGDTEHGHDDATVDVPDTSGQTLCDVYCATAEEVCTGANRLYAETATCLDACTQMREGQGGDRSGDTVQCRIFHLELGRADPITHCPHASESGGGTCVFPNEDLCRRYCGAAMENCLNADGLYPSIDACLDACFTITDAGTPDELTNDTVHCRLSHADAALNDPTTHCPLAAVEGSTACVNP